MRACAQHIAADIGFARASVGRRRSCKHPQRDVVGIAAAMLGRARRAMFKMKARFEMHVFGGKHDGDCGQNDDHRRQRMTHADEKPDFCKRPVHVISIPVGEQIVNLPEGGRICSSRYSINTISQESAFKHY